MKRTKKSPQVSARGRTPAQPPIRLPSILLEGDEPNPAGPTTRPVPQPKGAAPERTKLPEAYGTRTLLLAAREPHSLYAHWDITPREQRQYCAEAALRHLTLRVRESSDHGAQVSQVNLGPGSQACSVPVPRADTKYVAELGYVSAQGRWQGLATSAPVSTPPEAVSHDTTVRFATVARAQASVPGTGPDHGNPGPTAATPGPSRLPPAPLPADPSPSPPQPAASVHPQSSGGPPPPSAVATRVSPAARKRATSAPPGLAPGLARTVTAPAGNVLLDAAVPNAAAGVPKPPPQVHSVATSPGGPPSPTGGGREPAFWLNVGAELVLYGATEPDAQVAIDGQPIPLRPDGTFSYRLAFPDGVYDLVVTAVSREGERRQVSLVFSRRTD